MLSLYHHRTWPFLTLFFSFTLVFFHSKEWLVIHPYAHGHHRMLLELDMKDLSLAGLGDKVPSYAKYTISLPGFVPMPPCHCVGTPNTQQANLAYQVLVCCHTMYWYRTSMVQYNLKSVPSNSIWYSLLISSVNIKPFCHRPSIPIRMSWNILYSKCRDGWTAMHPIPWKTRTTLSHRI